MSRREPTIHNRALMVRCRRCGSFPGALCYDSRGRRLDDGRVHRDRSADARKKYPTT